MPSGCALAVMMNSLTTTDAIPTFTGAIGWLMRQPLMPGGTILVPGGYRRLVPEHLSRAGQGAQAAQLQVLPGRRIPGQPDSGRRSSRSSAH
jgi:hypothetical protein